MVGMYFFVGIEVIGDVWIGVYDWFVFVDEVGYDFFYLLDLVDCVVEVGIFGVIDYDLE